MLATWIARRHSPSVQAGVLVVALALAGFFLVEALGKAMRPNGYDVHCFLTTAEAVRAGTNPYLVEMPIPYNYPLFACSAAVPLTYLPQSVVHVGWFLATLAAWIGACRLVVQRWIGAPLDRGLLLPLGAATLLLIGALQNHLLNGQTDAFVLLLCVAFWIDLHEGRSSRAALWLGLGVSLKLVPALFFLPLILRRSWGTLALSCVWIVVLSVGLPALFLGTEVMPSYVHYAKTVLLTELHTSAQSVQFPHNYTLFGALTWLVPAWRHNLIVRLLATLAVVGPLALLERRDGSSRQQLARFEAYLAGILLLAPLSQPHHLTLLLPAVWMLALRWVAMPRRPWWMIALELAPFALFPLWKFLGGPIEMLAVAGLFVGALIRTVGEGGRRKEEGGSKTEEPERTVFGFLSSFLLPPSSFPR
jgi:Glycosyltransferase family 87